MKKLFKIFSLLLLPILCMVGCAEDRDYLDYSFEYNQQIAANASLDLDSIYGYGDISHFAIVVPDSIGYIFTSSSYPAYSYFYDFYVPLIDQALLPTYYISAYIDDIELEVLENNTIFDKTDDLFNSLGDVTDALSTLSRSFAVIDDADDISNTTRLCELYEACNAVIEDAIDLSNTMTTLYYDNTSHSTYTSITTDTDMQNIFDDIIAETYFSRLSAVEAYYYYNTYDITISREFVYNNIDYTTFELYDIIEYYISSDIGINSLYYQSYMIENNDDIIDFYSYITNAHTEYNVYRDLFFDNTESTIHINAYLDLIIDRYSLSKTLTTYTIL